MLLSGTPAQVKPLIPSAENGLFSRQLFYYMPAIREWRNQFDRDDTDLEAVFTDMGRRWKKRLDALKQSGMYDLKLNDAQRRAFNEKFTTLFERSGFVNGNEMSSSIARLAINVCRMMSIVAVLRTFDDPRLKTPARDTAPDNLKDGIISRWDVSVSPADFDAVMALVEPLYRHATHILSFLPSTEVRRRTNADRDALFASLSSDFTRHDLMQAADKMGINRQTALTWAKRMS